MVSLVNPTPSLKGKPHYRRTQEVYAVLNTAPSDVTYDCLIEYVRVQTGKGCSRKLISKWKKTVTFSVSSDQLSVPSKLTKNSQVKSGKNNTDVLPIIISCDQNPVDLTTPELTSEINQIESDTIQTVELLESEANLSIIGDEDKPEIVHQNSLPIEEECTDSKRSLTNNGIRDSLTNSDNHLSPIPDNEKTGHWSLITDHYKAWSYVAATAIVCGVIGSSWLFAKDNSKPVIAQPTTVESIQNASTNSDIPVTQNQEVQNRRVQNGIPRTFKISLTVTNPQDLKVKPGDEISLGQVLSDRTTERQRLLAQKKQLEMSLKKLDLPIPEITQPKPIPALSKLPPVSYQQEEANIALKQQELAEAERAIANQKTKIKELEAIQSSEFTIQNELIPNQGQINNEPSQFNLQKLSSNTNSIKNTKSDIGQISLGHNIQKNTEQQSHQNKERTISKNLLLLNNSDNQSQLTENSLLINANRSLITVIEHEKVVLKKLIAARDKAKLQLDIAKSKLITVKERRAHAEYQRYLEGTKRAIAIQQQQIELERQRSIRAGQIQEREYSKAQIETKIQEIDNAISSLSTVKAPYSGRIKKVKWTGQDNHNLTVQLTLDVDTPSEKPTITSKQ